MQLDGDEIDTPNRKSSRGATDPCVLVVVEVLPWPGPRAKPRLHFDRSQVAVNTDDQIDLITTDTHIAIDDDGTATFEKTSGHRLPGDSNRRATRRHPMIVSDAYDKNQFEDPRTKMAIGGYQGSGPTTDDRLPTTGTLMECRSLRC
jgi:hypothetical protein